MLYFGQFNWFHFFYFSEKQRHTEWGREWFIPNEYNFLDLSVRFISFFWAMGVRERDWVVKVGLYGFSFIGPEKLDYEILCGSRLP